MVLVSAVVMPHGSMILDTSLEGLPVEAKFLHDHCVHTANAIAKMSPDVIILFTPHGMSVDHELAVYMNQAMDGSAEWAGFWKDFSVNSNSDCDMARRLINHLNENNLPTVGITHFAAGFPARLQWGEVVPLWFCRESVSKGTKCIIVSWPRDRLSALSYQETANLCGQLLSKFLREEADRIAVIFSCDMSHVHETPPNTPAQFTCVPSLGCDVDIAQQFDSAIVRWASALSGGTSEAVAVAGCVLREEAGVVVESALACGWSGFCALQACLEEEVRWSQQQHVLNNSVECPSTPPPPPLDFEHLRAPLWTAGEVAYGAPTYFGMMTASFSFSGR